MSLLEKQDQDLVARRQQFERADIERHAKEEAHYLERMEAGAVLEGISGGLFSEGGFPPRKPRSVYRLNLFLDFPATAGNEINAVAERRLANQWLEEFQTTNDFKTAVRLKDQLAESKKELKAAEDTVLATEQKLKAALIRGADVAKVEAELGTVRGRVSVLTSRCHTLTQLSGEAEKSAREKYLSFVAGKKQAALAEMTTAFEKLSAEWIGRANIRGLLDLLALTQALPSVQPQRPSMPPVAAEIARPLKFDEASSLSRA